MSACGFSQGEPTSTNSFEETTLATETVTEESGVTEGKDSSGSAGPELQTIDLTVPIIPSIALPDLSAETAAENLVSEKLGDLVSPSEGVEILSASCVDDTGENGLVYSGSTTGSDVFEINEDGSGTYVDETKDGKVELAVSGDGSGVFVDSTDGLLTIEVATDGSGEYYHEDGTSLITIVTNADGSGQYHNSDRGLIETASLSSDGSGEYYREDDNELLTVTLNSEGVGEYYRQQKDEGLVTTIRDQAGESWRYVQSSASQTVRIDVNPDGSGSYEAAGRSKAAFEFDANGVELGEQPTRQVRIQGQPSFTVSAAFPDLGRLGSLKPPCATVIRFDSQLLFGFNQVELQDEAADALDTVAEALSGIEGPIEIAGHSDSVGTEEANNELSLQRALVVEAELKNRGVEVAFVSKGYGESRPVEPNELPDGTDNPSGRSQNRRVEIVIPQ